MAANAPDQHHETPQILIGGGVALVLFPTLVLGAGLPIWAGMILAAALGACAALLGGLTLRGATGRTVKLGLGRPDAHASVLEEARAAVERVGEAAGRITRPDARAHAEAIHAAGGAIAGDVAEDPALLAAAQRVLTYYLPRAADLAEALALLEAAGEDPARREALAQVLGKLAAALGAEARRLREGDLRALDAEIRLVQSAMKEDFGG